MARDWSTVVCMASGPSLTVTDADAVRAWRDRTGHGVIVTNNTYQLAPWADVLYGMDSKWWDVMRPEFNGERLSGVDHAPTAQKAESPKGGNSGAGALFLAAHRGAKRIILLGYDGQAGDDGKKHWHGSHQEGLKDADSMKYFYGQMKDVTARLGSTEIINCSRSTAYTLWSRMDLTEALQG